MKGFTDLLNSLGEEIDKIPPRIVPQQARNNHQSKATGVRVYPLVSFAPFKWFLADSQAGTSARWGDPCDAVPRAIRNQKKMKWAPGTVTAVVRKENDVNCIFMLTVGHAFWDMDLNKSSSQQVDANEGRVSNTLNFWWGEFNMDLVQDIGPHSESYGQYYRMGDKLGSKVDCGLARVNSGVVWSNYYAERIPGYLAHTNDPHELARGIFINLVALDDRWPPPDGSYRVREVTITSKEFIFCDHFFSQFENWEGKSGSEIERAMIRPRPLGNDAGANGTSCKNSLLPFFNFCTISDSPVLTLSPQCGQAHREVL